MDVEQLKHELQHAGALHQVSWIDSSHGAAMCMNWIRTLLDVCEHLHTCLTFGFTLRSPELKRVQRVTHHSSCHVIQTVHVWWRFFKKLKLKRQGYWWCAQFIEPIRTMAALHCPWCHVTCDFHNMLLCQCVFCSVLGPCLPVLIPFRTGDGILYCIMSVVQTVVLYPRFLPVPACLPPCVDLCG